MRGRVQVCEYSGKNINLLHGIWVVGVS